MSTSHTPPKNDHGNFSRRKFIASSLIIAAGTALHASAIPGFMPVDASDKFIQKPLDYTFDALEPHIDGRTMEIHYTKHHAGYISNLNKAIKGTAGEKLSLNEILKHISNYEAAVRNNAGGHYNHEMFWKILNPEKTFFSTKLKAMLDAAFGSVENFKKLFQASAMKVFGSGWTWLYIDKDNNLAIGNTPNQDNPLMDVSDIKGNPVFGIDVWEHAYYLKYQNKRAEYLEAVWNVLNWEEIEKRYLNALK